MKNVTLDRAVEVVRALRPEEQSQLRAMMDSWRPLKPLEATPEQQRRLAEALLADGLIERLPARYQPNYDPENGTDQHSPVSVIGRPVSETLLEDREPH